MPTFLHVGCGQQPKGATTRAFADPEWMEVRFDIDPSVEPDIVGSMTDMSAVPDASMDAIFSSHNIEHLYAFEAAIALREFARVLKPEGFAVITCPDIQAVAALVAEGKLLEPAYHSASGPIAPIDILYGHRPALARGHSFMAHKTGFTRKVLAQTLQASGFGSVIARSRPACFDLWAAATRTASPPERLRALAAQHFPRDPAVMGSGAT